MNLFLYWINEDGGNPPRFQLFAIFQSFSVGLGRKELEQEDKIHKVRTTVLFASPEEMSLNFRIYKGLAFWLWIYLLRCQLKEFKSP